MSSNSEYHDYVMYDVLGGISGITSKKMFGGWGIYKDGIFFALIADVDLYFKTDKSTLEHFSRYGSEPFSYTRLGKTAVLKSYWRVPEEVMEDREKILEWAEEAVQVVSTRKKKFLTSIY